LARKYTRKHLRQPDEFISLSMRVWTFVGDHAAQVLITVGIAAAIVGGIWTWDFFATRSGEKATAQLTRATDIYNQTIAPTETKVPATDEDGLPRFKTRAEKLKAAEDEFGKVVGQGGTMAIVARGMRASARYDGGKFAEAVDDYKKVLEKTDDPRLRALAIEGLAYCYEAQKDYGKALQQFRLLPRDGDKKYLAQYQEARVLAKKGDVKEATSLYKEIIAKGAPSSLVDRASDRLALLEGK
jgi:predicted negative regulator of RcsB-dependent stress response